MVKIKNIGTNKTARTMLGILLSLTGGFVFSGSSIAGVSSFADISLAGSLGLPYAPAVLIGAMIRCVLTDSVGRCIVKLAAMSMIVSAKMFSERCSRPAGCGIVTAVSVILSGSAVSALIGEFPEKLLFYGLYGLISGFAAYSGAELCCDIREKSVVDLGGLQGCAYGTVYVLYTSSLYSLEIPFIEPGLILGTAVTMAAAYFYGGAGGIICGALAASGAFLASPEMGAEAAMLPVSGLFVGFMRRKRIAASGVFFALSFFMLSVLTGTAARAELTLSVVFGISLFVIAAPHFSDKWISAGGERISAAPDISGIRFGFLSDAIEAVRLDSGRISAALAPVCADTGDVSPDIGKICSGCYRRRLCGRAVSETAGELIPVLPEECIHKKEAAQELENGLRSRAAENVMKIKFSEEREFFNEHMKMTAELVRKLGNSSEMRCSAPMSSRISEKLESHGICPEKTAAFYNSANRLVVEIYFGLEDILESTSRICDLVSDEIGVELCAGTEVSSAREKRICLFERPPYELEVYSASVSAEDSEISGDSSSVFTDSSGKSYVVLSDGMGSGKPAAVDSHMVIGIFRRLICSGMDLSAAVKMINSVMATKSRNESFATLDVVSFDPDDCRMVSVKSGAAATVLRSGSDVIKISSATFPVGIIKQAELSAAEYVLSDGDMIVMFSDGISDSACLFIKELLLGHSDIREIVREIALKANVFSPAERQDDITVIGIKVRSCR